MSKKVKLPIKTKEKPPEVHEGYFLVFGTSPEEIVNRSWEAVERFYQPELERLTAIRAQQDFYINEKDALFEDLYSRIRYLEKLVNNGVPMKRNPFSECEAFEEIFLEEGRALRDFVVNEAIMHYKPQLYELFIECMLTGIGVEEYVLLSEQLRAHIEHLENRLRENNIPFD